MIRVRSVVRVRHLALAVHAVFIVVFGWVLVEGPDYGVASFVGVVVRAGARADPGPVGLRGGAMVGLGEAAEAGRVLAVGQVLPVGGRRLRHHGRVGHAHGLPACEVATEVWHGTGLAWNKGDGV